MAIFSGFNVGSLISLGDMELAIEYLQNSESFEPELGEIKKGFNKDASIKVTSSKNTDNSEEIIKSKFSLSNEASKVSTDEDGFELDDEDTNNEYEENTDEEEFDLSDDEEFDLSEDSDDTEEFDMSEDEDTEFDMSEDDENEEESEEQEDDAPSKEELELLERINAAKQRKEAAERQRIALLKEELEKAERDAEEAERIKEENQRKEKAAQEEILKRKIKEREAQQAELQRKQLELQRKQEELRVAKELKDAQELAKQKAARQMAEQLAKKKEIDNKRVVAPSIDYSAMDIDALYAEVKKYLIEQGVKKAAVEKKHLDEKFGKLNISKLLVKGYIISVGKGVTIGR